MNPRDVATVPDEGEGEESELPSRLGHFEIVGRLGAGGMGLVFEGKDLVLGRRVALKLLHPGRVGNPIAPARLLREAQALAKLSHRNVVTVYEVGMAGEEPFVAMELVEGETLAAWMKQRHEWRTVLDVFIAAGHGLAAVHAIGLVHRDFKPSNVLFDKDGTPKLGDFGLVRPLEAPPEPATAGAPVQDEKLTQTGSVMGTPAYMAPEQRLGLGVDTRADQYSFAKSLSEALGDKVPAKLQPILARALADDPDERYPSMAPLLEDLSRARRGNRVRWIVAGAAVAAVAALAIAWGFGRAQSAGEACARPTDRVAKVWSPQRRSALQIHMIAIDPMLGPQRFAISNGVFDRGATRWMDQHVDACREARAGRQSGALLDRRMACLDRALHEIDDSVAVLETAPDRTKLDDAMKATVRLPALDDCADVNALMELLPRPTNPAQRAEADALAREITAIDVAFRTGGSKPSDVVDRANAAVLRARLLGDPVTLASALHSLARVQRDEEAGEATLFTLREAIKVAAEAHDDRNVASLYTDELAALVSLKKPGEAKTLLPAAEAAVARARASVHVQAEFLNAKANVQISNRELDVARTTLDDALKLLDAAGASGPFSTLRQELILVKSTTALVYNAAGDFKSMADALRDVIALTTAMYGPDHPMMMRAHWNRGVALRRLGDDEGALVEFREAARIGEARLSPSPSLSDYLLGVGGTLVAMDKPAEALPYLERATAMARATLPKGDPRLADTVGALAAAKIDSDQFDAARPLLAEQIGILEGRGTRDERLAIAYFNRAHIAVLQHLCDANAEADFETAMKIYREIGMPEGADETLLSVAECQLQRNHFADALRTTEQVLAAKDLPGDSYMVGRFYHGRCVAFLGHPAQGIAEVRAARAEMVKVKSGAIDVVDKWLETWAKPGVTWPRDESKH